jgi:peptidoglycan-associated lipoprotein
MEISIASSRFDADLTNANIMKLNKIVLPLAVALMAMLATTGCKHGFNGRVTNLPGHRQPTLSDSTPNTLPPGPAFVATPIPTANPNPTPSPFGDKPPGTTPTSDEFNIGDYTQDRAALAAYTVHFKFDSAVVQDKETANIASVAKALSDPSLRLLVEGHCDERGTEEYNRALGERRALSLREALAKVGVDPMHVKTISYGKDKPADDGHNEAAWAKNRRGEFVLLHPKAPVQ